GQGRAAAAPGGQPFHLDPISAQLALERECPPEDLRIERACQPAVGGDRQQRDAADVLPALEQRQPHRAGGLGGDAHQLEHPVGVGPHRVDARFGSTEAGRGDELERLGDLLRIADGADPTLQVLDGGHYETSDSSFTAKVSANFSISWRSFSWASSESTFSSRKPSLPAKIAATSSSSAQGWYCGWFRVATIRSPRASVFCVAGSSSEPNCENASSSRYWARSSFSRPATDRIAFVCAFPPTRETEMPTLIAGRTPE